MQLKKFIKPEYLDLSEELRKLIENEPRYTNSITFTILHNGEQRDVELKVFPIRKRKKDKYYEVIEENKTIMACDWCGHIRDDVIIWKNGNYCPDCSFPRE